MHDDENADEAGDDGDQTVPADPLTKQRTGERGHQQGASRLENLQDAEGHVTFHARQCR